MLNKLHEWAAERFSFVQYPQQEFISNNPIPKLFEYQMTLDARLFLGLMSLFALAILMPLFIAMLIVIWCAI